MLGLQKIFLLVRFFNQISCNKGLKAKISCFLTCFFCLTPLRLECSRSRKTALFLTSHRLKKYKNLHPWSFTNGAKTCEITPVCFYNSFILALFTACFYLFLFWRYLNSSMTTFLSDIVLPFPNSNNLNSREQHSVRCFGILATSFMGLL